MAVRKIKAVVRDNRHLETREIITVAKPGQEVELFIYHPKKSNGKKKPFAFTNHNFGKWYGERIRREEIYHIS